MMNDEIKIFSLRSTRAFEISTVATSESIIFIEEAFFVSSLSLQTLKMVRAQAKISLKLLQII
jgi:hypothetical protein